LRYDPLGRSPLQSGGRDEAYDETDADVGHPYFALQGSFLIKAFWFSFKHTFNKEKPPGRVYTKIKTI
jgi:hypothetical protein